VNWIWFWLVIAAAAIASSLVTIGAMYLVGWPA
jgi:hypothetical protein